MKYLFVCLIIQVIAKIRSETVYLSQNDFKEKSFIISSPGNYVLTENISFSPKVESLLKLNVESLKYPELLMFPSTIERESNGNSLNLGYFAAIIVASDNVLIDLNGFTIQQSNIHMAMQRFFAVIELANSPFPPTKGPANFTTTNQFISVENVTLRNGIIGQSSHHGIHCNSCKNIKFQDLLVRNFEVAGISLNAADNVTFENIIVEDSRRDIRYSAKLSQVIFSLQAYTIYIEPYLNFNDIEYGEELQDKVNFKRNQLRQVLKKVISLEVALDSDVGLSQVAMKVKELPPLVRTVTNGLPDGSLVAGIIIHAEVNVDEFKAEFNEDQVENIVFINVTVQNLSIKSIELTGLKRNSNLKAVTDMVGGAFDIDNVRNLEDIELSYKPNALSEFQLVLTKLRITLENSNFKVNPSLQRLFARDGITKDILDWCEADLAFIDVLETNEYSVFNNGDVMFHFIKGVIGIKVEQTSLISMKDVKIQNLYNFGEISDRSFFYQNLPLAGSLSENTFDIENYDISTKEYYGFGVRGLQLAGDYNVTGQIEVKHLYSNSDLAVKPIDFVNFNEDINLELIQSEPSCKDNSEFRGIFDMFDRVIPYLKRDEFQKVNENKSFSFIIVIVGVGIVLVGLFFILLWSSN